MSATLRCELELRGMRWVAVLVVSGSERVLSVLDFGAVGDGRTLCTAALRAAAAAASETGPRGTVRRGPATQEKRERDQAGGRCTSVEAVPSW